jgi:hypothetical protein
MCAVAGYVYAPNPEVDSSDIEAIKNVSRDYWESWYTGDAELMGRCLHPEWDCQGLIHRIVDERTDYIASEVITRSEQLQLTEAGLGVIDQEDWIVEIDVLAATHHLAAVKTVGKGMIDFLHLMKFPEGWRVIQTIWTLEGGVIANATTDI